MKDDNCTCAIQPDREHRSRLAKRCTWVGFWVNAVLSVLKIIAGIIGHSGAMVADGIHSISDFVTDVIVIVMVGAASKMPDKEHRYGHGKYETFATFTVSIMLGMVGLSILYSGSSKIWGALHGVPLEAPGYIALIMAGVSIVAKEVLYHYTIAVGKKIDSMAVVANAWHHRSDALTSIATLIGIGGAIIGGAHWHILDPMAAIVVSFFIMIMAHRLGRPAIDELLEASLPSDELRAIEQAIIHTPGVIAYHRLRTRHNGTAHIVDVHIKVDANLTVLQAHDEIADRLEINLQRALGEVIPNIHIEPYTGEAVDDRKHCQPRVRPEHNTEQ